MRLSLVLTLTLTTSFVVATSVIDALGLDEVDICSNEVCHNGGTCQPGPQNGRCGCYDDSGLYFGRCPGDNSSQCFRSCEIEETVCTCVTYKCEDCVCIGRDGEVYGDCF